MMLPLQSMKFDLFPDKKILYKVFLELLVQVIIKFVFFRVRIIDVVFRVLIMTFLEKFCLLYNLVSYLGVCHNGLRQNRCCL